MLFRLVRPVLRKDTRNPQFVQRIPEDLRSRLVGMTLEVPVGDGLTPVTITDKAQAIRFSLRTSDPGEVKKRQAAALAYLEGVYANLRANAPVSLTHKQCVALAGEVYRAWAADLESFRMTAVVAQPDGSVAQDFEFDPEIDLEMEAEGARLAAERLLRLDGVEAEKQIGPLIDRVLLRHGIPAVDARSRAMLLVEFPKALAEGLATRGRKASGHYSHDPVSERFPEWVPPSPAAEPKAPERKSAALTLDILFDGWWAEAKAAGRKQSTHDSYRRTLTALGAFLKHKDPARITPEDVIAFKDHRLREGAGPKTIKDSDLAALKAVFGWAVLNRKIAANPAQGITLKVGRKGRRRLRSPGFTDAEAKAILSRAAAYRQGTAESWRMAAAKRWVPWLCAFTGARVGEIVQLRRQDIREEGGGWVIHITPEAGTVKTDEARDVPLHPQLVEMGFPAFLAAAPENRLFMKPADESEKAWRGAWRTAKNRVTEFVKGALGDAKVAPNHGWRHRFTTLATELGFSGRVEDAILGHAPASVADDYGEVTLRARRDAIDLLPRTEVPGRPFEASDLRWNGSGQRGRVKKRKLVPRRAQPEKPL